MTKEEERMSPEAIENKRRYNAEYFKEKYARISFGIPKEEAEEFKKLMKKNGFSNIEFLRLCIKLLKEGKIKKED
jgi:hypothetical protein